MLSSGSGWLYDQLREIPRGADPNVLLEWSDIMERRANENCGVQDAARVRFHATVNLEGRFELGLDAPDPDAMVCMLNAIQSNLDLMPKITRELFGALMVSLAATAESKDALSKDS